MNNIASTGILLLGLGYCIQSIATAIALPNGPTVSIGSNPIESFYGASNNVTLNLNPNYDFILTTGYSDNTSCILTVNGINVNRTASAYNVFYYNVNDNPSSGFSQGQGSLSIPAGASAIITNCGNYLFSGYYVQP